MTNKHENWCFYLRPRTESSFVYEYCDESAVPSKTSLGSTNRPATDYCVGDFDGDGYMDRIRVETDDEGDVERTGVSRFALYFAKGDGSRYISERRVATMKQDCLSNERCVTKRPNLEAVYKPSIQRHVFGYFNRTFDFFGVDISSIFLKA